MTSERTLAGGVNGEGSGADGVNGNEWCWWQVANEHKLNSEA